MRAPAAYFTPILCADFASLMLAVFGIKRPTLDQFIQVVLHYDLLIAAGFSILKTPKPARPGFEIPSRKVVQGTGSFKAAEASATGLGNQVVHLHHLSASIFTWADAAT